MIPVSNAYVTHDQLLTSGSKSYAYDSNGNCTSVTVGTSVTSLTYDYENRVTGITYPSSATNSFTYNGNDLRLQKVDSAGTFNYVCDGTTPASAVLKDGSAVYTPGRSERRGTTSKFYHADALGSTRGITNSSQTVTDSVLYDAFGMTVSRTGTTPTPFGFVGSGQYQTDSDSGLMLLGHRYYDASVGRFISSDPAKSGGNWYAYCNNNPLRATDPLGLDTYWQQVGNFAQGELRAFGDVAWRLALPPALSSMIHLPSFAPPTTAQGGNEAANNGYAFGSALATIGQIAAMFAGEGCFVAGTPVQMADGSTKPIEKVKPGDRVLSRSQSDYEIAANGKAGHSKASACKPTHDTKTVVRTYVHHTPTLRLTLEGSEKITTTAAHPFYVAGQGFVKAGKLAIGNAIVTRAGPALKVVGIHRTGKTQIVYNFEVQDFHTYFVGKANGGMWVHNICGVPEGGPESGSPSAEGSTSGTTGWNPNRTPKDNLPRDKGGRTIVSDPNAEGPHTVIGTRTNPSELPEHYRQGVTFDGNGEPVGRTDVSTHGRSDHPNPHFHPWNGRKFGPQQPILLSRHA